ncbi:MAG: hypothetical protein IPF92_19335 [Myxococcales bacterium]|nr:hypothetical protein [Myxococcales bacterium]
MVLPQEQVQSLTRTLARLRVAIKLVVQIDAASLRRDRAVSALAIVDVLEREIGVSK